MRPSAPGSEAPLPVARKRLELLRATPSTQADPLPDLNVLRSELVRGMVELGRLAEPPYYLAYEVSAIEQLQIAATGGALLQSERQQFRGLDVEVRVGSAELDNTHGGASGYRGIHTLPLDHGEPALRNQIWLATDAAYKQAIEELLRVRAEKRVGADEADDSADFSAAPVVSHFEAAEAARVDRPAWERRVRELSALFDGHPEIHRSYVRFSATARTRLFVDSAGSQLQTPHTHARLAVGAVTIAPDGTELAREDWMDAREDGGLPALPEARRRVARLIDDLRALRDAPVGEPYLGPAILDGPAAAVFFHEVFGHRVEGHRQKDESEGQTFAGKVGELIMPTGFDVYDDPRIHTVNGTALNGFYSFDDEAVRAKKAALVDDGRFVGFLMSRSPIRGFTSSNGHGRRQLGFRSVARQANLVVDPRQVTTTAGLKQALLREIRRQNKPFGLRIGEVTGGYTMTERSDPQAFVVTPIMVFKVFPDGREQLVRGVTLEGTPLSVLSKLIAAADDFAVFNGFCGAESGEVPASAVSPSLLVAQLEVTRQPKGNSRPPLLPPPPLAEPATAGSPR